MAEIIVTGPLNLIENPSVSSQEIGDCSEPPLKKSKIDVAEEQGEDLEQRLNEILCCSVCLDLPVNLVYQVRFRKGLGFCFVLTKGKHMATLFMFFYF